MKNISKHPFVLKYYKNRLPEAFLLYNQFPATICRNTSPSYKLATAVGGGAAVFVVNEEPKQFQSRIAICFNRTRRTAKRWNDDDIS